MRVFLAGAAGAIGRRLVPLLLRAGHEVTGTTRSAATASELARAGVVPAVLDIFDAQAVTAAVGAAKPAVIIHQLTDLPRQFDEARIAASYPKNARIGVEGTRNLIALRRPPRRGGSSCKASPSATRLAASRIGRPIRSILPTRCGR